jgi:hypothetical protein
MNNKMNPGQGININPKIIKDAPLLLCDCGGALFTEKIMIKKISAIVSPTGNEELFPLNVLICDSCGKIPKELNIGEVIPESYITKKS